MGGKAGWRAWKERTFGSDYLIWHDGLATDDVTRLSGSSRQRAIDMLHIGLLRGDPHAAQALAAMGERSSAPLVRRAYDAQPSLVEKLMFAVALNALEPDASLVQPALDILERSTSWSARVDAVIALRHFPAAMVTDLLLRCVAEEAEYLVRYHAAGSLLQLHGVRPTDVAKHPAIFDDLCDRSAHRAGPVDPHRFARAASALRVLVDARARAQR